MTDPEKPPALKKAVDYYGPNVIELIRRRTITIHDPLAAELKAGIEAIAREIAEYTMRKVRAERDHPKGVTELPDEKAIADLEARRSAAQDQMEKIDRAIETLRALA